MNIYLVLNVEHSEFYDPYMFIEDEVDLDEIYPSLNELASNTMDELKENSI